MRTTIQIQGARENNLQNVDVEIPRDKLIVVTGVSASGKSSLAFDTIYTEGQRRLLASMSTFAKRFSGTLVSSATTWLLVAEVARLPRGGYR
jgi:excinuclease ABC subunit A